MKSKQPSQIIARVTIVGAVVDLTLAIIKMVVGWWSNSLGLLADGIHSLSDLFTDALILFINKFSKEEPDAQHPYGHERFETLMSLTLAVILAITGAWLVLIGIKTISLGQAQQALLLLPWVFTVIIISIVGKEVLYRWTYFYGKKIQSNILLTNAWHHRSDAISSVIVLIGALGSALGFKFLDSVAGIILGAMIIYIAYKLSKPCIAELLDSAIEPHLSEQLKQNILALEDVVDIHNLRTRRSGRRIIVDLHIQVSPELTVSEGHMVSIAVEKVAQESFDNVVDIIVHIDPEDDDETTTYEHIPTRKQIIDLLQKHLNYNIKTIKLHYLANKVSIDVYFGEQLTKAQQTEIKKQLKSFSQTHPFCKQVNSYYTI